MSSRRLDTLFPLDFSRLPDGVHVFLISGPDGHPQMIRLFITGGRKQVRLGQFDMWTSTCNILPDSVREFNIGYREYWDVFRKKIPQSGISIPDGESTFTVSALRPHFGDVVKQAAQVILNPANLYDIMPNPSFLS